MISAVVQSRDNSAVLSQRPGTGRKKAKRQLPQESGSCLQTMLGSGGGQGDIFRDGVTGNRVEGSFFP